MDNEKTIEQIFEEAGLESSEYPGLDEFAMLLALPDEQFDTLAPLVLEELQKSFNNPDDQYRLQLEMAQAGYDAAEMTKAYADIMESIDDTLSDFSQNKIDFLKQAITIIFSMIASADGAARKPVSIPIEVMEYGILPTYAHDGDAAMDIYSPAEYIVDPGQTVIVKTGLKVAIPRGFALLIQPRSGQSLKTRLRIPNTPGLIDCGYRDEIGVLIENIEPPMKDNGAKGKLYGQSFKIEKGQRIAQMRLVEVPTIVWQEVAKVGDIGEDRGGGFGSSGK